MGQEQCGSGIAKFASPRHTVGIEFRPNPWFERPFQFFASILEERGGASCCLPPSLLPPPDSTGSGVRKTLDPGVPLEHFGRTRGQLGPNTAPAPRTDHRWRAAQGAQAPQTVAAAASGRRARRWALRRRSAPPDAHAERAREKEPRWASLGKRRVAERNSILRDEQRSVMWKLSCVEN